MNSFRNCVLIMAVLACVVAEARAQSETEHCRLMLQNGLYRTYSITRTANFTQDVRAYLTSNEFRQDLRNGKWGGFLSVVVDAIPIKIGADASNEQITTFQQQVTSATSFSLDQSFYEYAHTAIPDVELAREYTNCIRESIVYGFKVTANVNERDVYFVVTYRKQVSTDPMPRVTLFDVRNGTNVQKSFSLGGFLQDNNTIAADRNPERDLSLILETDRGVVTYRVPAESGGFNKDIPVGTIISSYLNWTEFQAITQNNANNPGGPFWTARYSKWAPADGRAVPLSRFQTAVSQPNVPDLRGVFLRGLNAFDTDQPNAVDPGKADPEARNRGSFQPEAFKVHDHTGTTGVDAPDHSHGFGGYPFGVNYGNNNGTVNLGVPPNGFHRQTEGANTRHRHAIQPDGGNETRPKNVAIYYYIRIN